jgi:hypothetical protein
MSRKSSINKIKRDNSKSGNISASLVMYLYEKQHSPITTKFTGMGLEECDVISVSKSDYVYEWEIKISRQDFKRDFIKEKHNFIINEKFTYTRKGETLWRSPNYFNFVVPKNLITLDECPSYAGLIFMNDDFTFEQVKKPPLLHKTKADDKFIRALAHNLSCKLIFNKVI